MRQLNTSEVFDETLRAIAHPLEYSVADCFITGIPYNCEDVFEVVDTDAG